MTFAIRPFEQDFTAVAALLGTTPDQLEAAHARFPADGLRHRTVAVDQAGAIIGYANTTHTPTMPPGLFWVTLITAPGARRGGVATALLADLEAWARTHGSTRLESGVPDDDEATLAFAAARSFTVPSIQLVSSLSVPDFDESPWAGVVEKVQASGIRFFTLAEAPGEETLHKLYDLYKITDLDSPGYLGTDPALYPPYERWYEDLFGDDLVIPEGLIIAADGDRFVGCTIVQKTGEERALYTEYTGVLREYRYHQLGLALKLLSIRFAKQYGAPYMTTKNNSTNGPMLAVNQKLGYVKKSGRAWLAKDLT